MFLTTPKCLCALSLLLAVPSATGCHGACAATIVERVTSSDGRYDAIVFERSCAAFDRFRTHVSVLPAGKDPGRRPGNVYAADFQRDFVVRWKGSDSLWVDVFHADLPPDRPSSIGPVAITYYQSDHARLDSVSIAPIEYSQNHLKVAAAMLKEAVASGERIPESLDEFFNREDRVRFRSYAYDAWGTLPLIRMRNDSLTIISSGPDGLTDTEDDILYTVDLSDPRFP